MSPGLLNIMNVKGTFNKTLDAVSQRPHAQGGCCAQGSYAQHHVVMTGEEGLFSLFLAARLQQGDGWVFAESMSQCMFSERKKGPSESLCRSMISSYWIWLMI